MIPACIMNADVYTARIPRKNQYYRCVEAHFEELVGKWDDRYQQDYGYWRPYINWTSYINIWTVVTFTWVLPGSSVMTASMNIFCHFPVNAGIFALPAIKNGFSNSVNSCIPRCSNRYPIASGFLVSLKGSGAILCMTVACCPNYADAPGKSCHFTWPRGFL